LTELARPRTNLLAMMLRSMGLDLGAKARDILAKRLTGELRFKVGRPKKTLDHRRADRPAIGAAEELPAIERILRSYYPHQKKIHDRAVEIAARRADINDQTLLDYQKSPSRIRP
jgi:hypothetical protein